jgi:diaminohydroxyphosphoribosylaminopyrimidine deaminase/5-amino-6-(5-phosphoribosylamino)uracil reductase
MHHAIALSALGLGTTSPNPPVGCVILDGGGQVVGQGYHHGAGVAHAEVNALAAAGEQARGGTAIVTLEPCNHQGVTPPCHQALLDAGVRRVLIAVIDPTSRGAGGAARLRAAGVEVEVGVLEDEAKVVLGPWLTALAYQRPFLIWPYVVSADGRSWTMAEIPDADDLRRTADVVFHPKVSVAEAIPGNRRAGLLKLDHLPVSLAPIAAARALFDAGARVSLLEAHPAEAMPFLDDGLVDQVAAYLPAVEPSSRADGSLPHGILPPRFRVRGVERVGDYLRVDAVAARAAG